MLRRGRVHYTSDLLLFFGSIQERYSLHMGGSTDLIGPVQGEVAEEEATAYNPLDLFSGDAARMQKASAAMLDRPARNLRMFVDGQRIPNTDIPAAVSKWQREHSVTAADAASAAIAKALHASGRSYVPLCAACM